MSRKISLEDQIGRELSKQKSAEEELSLVEKLQEDLKKRKAEARRKLKEEKEKQAVVLGKDLLQTYKTTDLRELKDAIIEEFMEEKQLPISEDDFKYLTDLAEKLREGSFIDYKVVFQEIKKRF
ncbi:hypothetical protein ACI2JA_21365 [Alkalihalobacillus sp. NPDC078783]